MNIPEDINPAPKPPFELLERLGYSYKNLITEFSALVTDEICWEIAKADYGHSAQECFEYLKQIITTQQPPTKTEFILIECLELTRWIIPKTRSEHIARAFSCALLLILQGISNYESISDENETLVTFIDSISALNTTSKAAQELIIWRMITDYETEKKLYLTDESSKDYIDEITVHEFFIFSLLILMVFNQENEQDIDIIANWMIDMEKDAQNMAPFYNEFQNQHMPPERLTATFLLGQTNFNQRHDLWKSIVRQMQQWMAYVNSQSIHEKLNTMIECILNDKPMKF